MESGVDISKDGMEARAVLPPGANRESVTSMADVVRWLGAHGVVHGLDLAGIRAALDAARVSGTIAEEVVVAAGTAPVPGEDARIEFLFERGPVAGNVTEDGASIDYHERCYLHRVLEGDLLARKIPATAGVPGRDVRGIPVAAKGGKDVKIEVTGEASVSEDGLECHADADGVVVAVAGGKVGVFQEYTVPGDVDLHTGNLQMKGILKIQGWVREGFQVQATGDVLIGGGVEPSVVKTEANLFVHGGIVGDEKSVALSRGNLAAQYLESAQVHAGGDVSVHNGILNSQVTADGKVTVAQGKGYIVGGVVRAAKGVEVNELGSRAGVRTVIDVGLDGATRGKLTQMERDCAVYERNRQKISRTLAGLILKGKSGGLQASERMAFAKLVRFRREMEMTRQAMVNCWNRLDAEAARIKVHRGVYEGTTVIVLGRRLDIHEDVPAAGEFVLNVEEDRVTYLG